MEERRTGENRLFCGERPINFRPSLALALAAAVSAFLAFRFGYYALVLLAVCLAAVPVLLARRKKGKGLFAAFLFFAALAAVIFAVVFSFQSARKAYEGAPVLDGEYAVYGTVSDTSAFDGGMRYTLGDVRFYSREEFFASEFKVYLYVRGRGVLPSGTRVYAVTDVETLSFISYGRVNDSAVLDGAKYRAYAAAEEVFSLGKRFDLFGGVRDRMRAVLTETMEEDTANLAYAMMTGDCSLVDEGIMDSFRYGGVAHIFAVSGLHIATLYAVFGFLLKKCRLRAAWRLLLVGALLVFYTGVCGFTPSAVRSLVMCLVLALADTCGARYDALNSVSFAALTVMLIHPVYFYSVGYRLSVAAAAGIIILGGSLSRRLSRVRFIPKKAASAFSVCVSAQIASFPLLLDAFGYVPALGVLLNLVFVPLISAVFVVLFFCTFFAAAIPPAAAVFLWAPEQLLALSASPVLASDWRFLLICGFTFGGCALLWYLFWFVLTDRVNLKLLPRAAIALLLAIAFAAGMFARNFAFGGVRLKVYSMYGTGMIFAEAGGCDYLIVTGGTDPSYAGRFFYTEGFDRADAVILACSSEDAAAALPVIARYAQIGAAYIAEGAGIAPHFSDIRVTETDTVSLAGLTGRFYGEGFFFCAAGTEVFVAGNGFAGGGVPCDLLVAARYEKDALAACSPAFAVCMEEEGEGMLSVSAAGDLQILLKSDIITVKGRNVRYEIRTV